MELEWGEMVAGERTGLNGIDGEEVVGVHVGESSAHCDTKGTYRNWVSWCCRARHDRYRPTSATGAA